MRQLRYFIREDIQVDKYGRNAFIDSIERAWYGYTPEQQSKLLKYKRRLRV